MAVTATILSASRDGKDIQVNVLFEDIGNGLSETKTFTFNDISAITASSIQSAIRDEGNKYKVLFLKLTALQGVSGATLSI